MRRFEDIHANICTGAEIYSTVNGVLFDEELCVCDVTSQTDVNAPKVQTNTTIIVKYWDNTVA